MSDIDLAEGGSGGAGDAPKRRISDANQKLLEKFEGKSPRNSAAETPTPKRNSSTDALKAKFESPAAPTPSPKPRTSSTGTKTGDLMSKFEQPKTPSTNASAASMAARGIQASPATPTGPIVSGNDPEEDPASVSPRLSENPFMQRDSKIRLDETPPTGKKGSNGTAASGFCKCLCFAPQTTLA